MRQHRWQAVRVLAFVAAGVAMLAAAAPSRSVATVAQAQQAGDDSLRELAARLALSFQSLGPDGKPLTVQLLPGQLPSDLSITVPIPPDSSVIGSAVRRTRDGKAAGAMVVLDIPEAPDQILSLFTESLNAAGFTAPPNSFSPGAQGGFQQAFQMQSRFFCQSRDGPSVSVMVSPQPDGPADVRVNADTLNASICSTPGFAQASSVLLPSLTAPPGVVVQSGPFGLVTPAIGGSARSDITALTGMSVGDLEAWYAHQLEQAGWAPLASGADDTLAWSTFAVPDQGNAQGFLYVLNGPGSNRRVLHLDIATAPGA